MTGTQKTSQENELPKQEEFLDAVRRHICHVLGFDYCLIDLVRGHEIVNLIAFSSGNDNERNELLANLTDEHQQPLTVAHTLIAQKVKQTQKPWIGSAFSQPSSNEFPYVIMPIMDESGESAWTVKALLRIVCLDATRTIDDKDLSTLKLFCQHLASRLKEIPLELPDSSCQIQPVLSAQAEAVLVVHGSRHARRRLSRILATKYHVFEADSGTKTIELLKSNNIDLIVLDSEIPGTSGYALCRVLKEAPEWKHIPVIIVTPESNVTGKVEGLNAGAEDCLSDTCHEAELLARARASLRLRKTERDLSVQWQLLEDYAERLEVEIEKARQTSVNFSRSNQLLEQRNIELQQAKVREKILSGQTELLHRISDIIRRSFNVSENIGTMLEELAERYSLDCCFVVLPSEDTPQDTVRSEYVTSNEFQLMDTDKDLAILEMFKQAFHRDQALVISDVLRDRSVEQFRKTVLADMPVRSLFYIPVTYEEKLLGLIGGHKCQTEALWTMENKDFFKSVADQVAIGVTNARLYARVQRQATTDGLTGLYNHRTGQEKLADQFRLAERYQRNLAVVMIDVDHFKSINDNYGHPAGDSVLKTVAKIIRNNCRDVDIPVRYGGEEFLLILPEVSQEGAMVVAERIRKNVGKETVRHDDIEITLTASLGVASYPEDASESRELLDLADKALYMSKRLGRNQVHTASDLAFADASDSRTAHLSGVSHGSPSGEALIAQTTNDKKELSTEVVDMVKALASTLYAKSTYNKEHHLETAKFAELLAKMLGLSQQQVDEIRVASLLHDLGVLSIPEQIINKPGLVSEEEMSAITQHPQLGAQLLKPIKALKEICEIVEHHHECWDGTGYPHGLKGEEIPMPARIVSLVDAYHAMISDRPYRGAMTKQQAKQALKNGAGTQWDPFLVDVFITMLDKIESESKQ